jgi:hypothetical protein
MRVMLFFSYSHSKVASYACNAIFFLFSPEVTVLVGVKTIVIAGVRVPIEAARLC